MFYLKFLRMMNSNTLRNRVPQVSLTLFDVKVYIYTVSDERFEETELPSQNAFFNKLAARAQI